MDRSLAELESIVRNRICGVCTDRTVAGDCGSPDPCELFELFPRVARAILSVDSDDIQQYIDAIRRDVCSVCVQQEPDGSCEKRRRVACALDAYLVAVVDAIEEATGKSFVRLGPALGGDAGCRARPEYRW